MLTRRAYAKLNLVLRVDPAMGDGPRRGWHTIGSWMHAIELGDEITCRRLDEGQASRLNIEWTCDAPRPTPIDWPLESDLAFRAHGLLEDHCQRELPVDIQIRKRIPTGSGLGGGSSDAGCTLTALNELFDLGLDVPELQGLGHRLGSDVPFFIDVDAGRPPRPAVVGSFGEDLSRLDPHEDVVLLVIPPMGCETPMVYGEFDAMGAPGSDITDGQISEIARAGEFGSLFNDLAAPAFHISPELESLRDDLCVGLGTPVHLTGSGSTLFVIPTPADVEPARTIAQSHGAAVLITRLV